MKKRRRDLRTQKTYEALISAFQELLQEKSFEKITVRELCDRARTRTATFYNHFSDKYDFFSFMIRDMRREYSERANLQSTPEHPENYYIELLKIGFDFMDTNQKIIENFESDNLLMIMINSTSGNMVKDIRNHLEEDMKNGIHFPIDPDILTQIFIGAMVQCSRWWFEHRKTVSKEKVFEQLKEMIQKIYAVK
ncbi:TetR/AcrR family transcriptional regulator [Clostridium fermenticellae]|uniref:TetR/AcrR family transcriptional regulator n=1 Tax=Clostridium fermenticellae TaxID=2068654 RepID=A0A386H536_9CLOT|nr:TetR/AcrR family transcriptional regulator [Clostridium fermenticellae]